MGRARMGLRKGGAVHASKPKIGSDVNAASLMLQSAQSTATDPCRTHAVSELSSEPSVRRARARARAAIEHACRRGWH